MKFEAEIIKEIVDSRGHTKTSIHYQSECVEEWVKEVEGAYPKLCDYQPEWLNYSAENKVGVFPYATLTDVTSATVENVVPYAYKSAILKGQTLVNVDSCYTINDFKWSNISNIDNDGFITLNANGDFVNAFTGLKPLIKPNTKYLAIVDIKENTIDGELCLFGQHNGASIFSKQGVQVSSGTTGMLKYILTSDSEFTSNTNIALRNYLNGSSTQGSIIYRTMLIEYIDGMENWDIPFFRGMQSVKLPVLTTIGKNLFKDGDVQKGRLECLAGRHFNDSFVQNMETRAFSQLIKVIPNQTITISTQSTNQRFAIYLWDINKCFLVEPSGGWCTTNRTITIPSNVHYMNLYLSKTDGTNIDIEELKNSYQVEEGSSVTTYEPHKTNILTTPSDLELRGIDAVRDELNCLTAQVTQRIGEVVLDGSSDEGIDMVNVDDATLVRFNVFNVAEIKTGNKSKMLCRSLPYVFIHGLNGGASTVSQECISNHSRDTNMINIIIKRDKLSSVSVTGFRTYLQTNPLTIQYQLATESVKTVDLSVVDQDGNEREQIKPIEGTMHLSTSGETIKPLFSGEIPVEAITQNLASFIEE